jgi:hypothetical protein
MPGGRPRKTNDDVLLKSAELLGWALGGLEREIAQTRERLTSLTAQAAKLRQRIGRGVSTRLSAADSATEAAAETGSGRRRRKMSAAARQRMSEMMKKRWAERRKRTA